MLNELIIELDGLTVARKDVALLHAELRAAGVWHGRLTIGGIRAVPDMFYFLWHESGEAPVSILIRQDYFETEEGIRAAARDFLLKWERRSILT